MTYNNPDIFSTLPSVLSADYCCVRDEPIPDTELHLHSLVEGRLRCDKIVNIGPPTRTPQADKEEKD